MTYYCDYEALEFNSKAATKKGIFPYYLDPDKSTTALCPLMFSASDPNGSLVYSQNVFKKRISFLDFIKNQTRYAKPMIQFDSVGEIAIKTETRTIYCWFHNVSYDFYIILHELFFNGFKQVVDSKQITYIGEHGTPENNTFTIVGENLSHYIGANIYYRNYTIYVRDTMSILNSAQGKILRDFGYPPKVDVKWKNINIDNLREHMPTIYDRNIHDVKSLAICIEQFKSAFTEKFHGTGNTAGSMSLDALQHYLSRLNKSNVPANVQFRERYPMLPEKAEFLSNGCYHGGICTVNEKYAGKVIADIQMVDVNSSYPYAMTKPLPYGVGTPITDFTDTGYSEYIVKIEFSFFPSAISFQRCHSESLARNILDMPSLAREQIYTRNQFPHDFSGYLCINSIDLSTLKKYAYIAELEFMRGINYQTDETIADFIRPIYEERKKSEGVEKMAIKLLLNSLYGKFAQDLTGFVSIYQNPVEFRYISAIDNDPLYKPLSAAVTAYARANWVDTVYLLGDSFIYGDTDSAYFLNIDKSMSALIAADKIHDDELGKWSTDPSYGEKIIRGKFLSKKNYLIETIKGLKLTCVGLPLNYHAQINFDNFQLNSEPFEYYKMENIYGGKAMRKRPFQIRERFISI